MSQLRRALLDLASPLANRVIEPVAPAPENWEPMREVAARFQGNRGVVLHIGDSITRDPAYAKYALEGVDKTPAEVDICKWMHAGEYSERDGWFLASGEHRFPPTACNGITAREFLEGARVAAPVEELARRYKPQLAIVMFGTNEATRAIDPGQYRTDIERVLEILLSLHCIPVVSAIPPHHRRKKLAAQYNEAIRSIARERHLPLIDYFSEIASRQPAQWNGSLMQENDVHPSAWPFPAGPATPENLRECGYLLRGWLSIQKVAEVKRHVLDPIHAS